MISSVDGSIWEMKATNIGGVREIYKSAIGDIYAVGLNGSRFRSIDDGETWVKETGNLKDVTIYGVTETDTGRIVVVGSFGRVAYFDLMEKPTSLRATRGTTQIDLRWSDNSDLEVQYIAERSADGENGWLVIATLPENTQTYADADVDVDGIGFYRVRGFSPNETKKDPWYSDYSNVASVETAPISGYDAWVADKSLASSDAMSDTESDGIPNLLEYALDLDPKQFDASGTPTAVVNGDSLEYTFFRARGEDDATYIVESSSDMTNWSEVTVNPGSAGNAVTVSIPMGDDAKVFARLRVDLP